MASHQESLEMQEIMEKISNLMQKECLKFDDESDEEKGSKNKEQRKQITKKSQSELDDDDLNDRKQSDLNINQP